MDIGKVLSRGKGWLLWGQLKGILEITRGEFQSQVEKRFVDNLIVYSEYKIRERERIKNERKQLSFW